MGSAFMMGKLRPVLRPVLVQVSAIVASRKRAWLYRSSFAARTTIAVRSKVVEDGCFARQTGHRTCRIDLSSQVSLLRPSVIRSTHPAGGDFTGLHICDSERVGCRCSAFRFSVGHR